MKTYQEKIEEAHEIAKIQCLPSVIDVLEDGEVTAHYQEKWEHFTPRAIIVEIEGLTSI